MTACCEDWIIRQHKVPIPGELDELYFSLLFSAKSICRSWSQTFHGLAEYLPGEALLCPNCNRTWDTTITGTTTVSNHNLVILISKTHVHVLPSNYKMKEIMYVREERHTCQQLQSDLLKSHESKSHESDKRGQGTSQELWVNFKTHESRIESQISEIQESHVKLYFTIIGESWVKSQFIFRVTSQYFKSSPSSHVISIGLLMSPEGALD